MIRRKHLFLIGFYIFGRTIINYISEIPIDWLDQVKRAKEGLEKSGKGRKLTVANEVRMVAEPEVKYKKRM